MGEREALEYAKRLKDHRNSTSPSKEEAQDLLKRAGILTEKGNVRKYYKAVFTAS